MLRKMCQRSRCRLTGVLLALLLIVRGTPAHAVDGPVRVLDLGDDRWAVFFEAESFDQRDPDTADHFVVVEEASAFDGRAVQRTGTGGGRLAYTFDVPAGFGGGSAYFFARQTNPSNSSDYLLVAGDPGDPVIPDTAPYPTGDGATFGGSAFDNADDRVFEANVGSPPDNWAWGRVDRAEGHTKDLRAGQNTMYILHRQGDNSQVNDVYCWTNDETYVPDDRDYARLAGVCSARRAFSSNRYGPGDAVTVTLAAEGLASAATIVDTYPAGWTVSNDGGGSVDAGANTITFQLAMDGDVSYEVTAPAVCEVAPFSGKVSGCDTGPLGDDVTGDSSLRCFDIGSPPFLFDFDASGPTATDQVAEYFDILGVDGAWTIDPNAQNPENGSAALHTVSDGNALASYFSRALILAGLAFEDGEFAADITWDDAGGDANDNAGLYFRFSGNSDDPLGNEYYFLRIDAGEATSSLALHRVKAGQEEQVFARTDDPAIIVEGGTASVNILFDGPNITVTIGGAPVAGMNPLVDTDPLLGPGRVGVGQETNPAYFDNLRIRPNTFFDCDTEIAYFKGTGEPSPAADGSATAEWAQLGFDDGAWLRGQLPIGFGNLGLSTVLDDMPGNYSTLYMRIEFSVLPGDLPGGITFLRADWDDGFVAYLNGVEIVRTEGVEGMPPGFDGVSPSHGGSERPDPCLLLDDGHEDVEDFMVDTNLLAEGENVLGVQLFNSSLTSGDVTFLAKLFHETDVCNRDLACSYDVGDCTTTLTWRNKLTADVITIARDGETIAEITGDLETFTDPSPPTGECLYEVTATVGGSPCPTLTCSVVAGSVVRVVAEGDVWSFFRGKEEPSPGEDGSATTAWTEVDFDAAAWETGPSGFGYGDEDDMTVLDDMEQNYASVYIRKTVDVSTELLAAVADVIVVLTFDDSYVCYVNGVDVGRSGDDLEGNPPAFNAEPRDSFDGTRSFSVDPALIVAGTNVIAFQCHNRGIGSSDLTLIPEVFAVLGTPNEAPTAVIAVDPALEVVLPPEDGITQVTLDGSGSSDDGLGCGAVDLTYRWTKLSGPEGDNMITPEAPATIVTLIELGTYEYELAVSDGRAMGTAFVAVTVVPPTPPGIGKVPGDANGDGALNVSDVLYIASILFVDPSLALPCAGPPDTFDEGSNLAVLDFNGDAQVNISDIVANADWQFSGGPPHPLNMAEEGPGCALLAECGDADQCTP